MSNESVVGFGTDYALAATRMMRPKLATRPLRTAKLPVSGVALPSLPTTTTSSCATVTCGSATVAVALFAALMVAVVALVTVAVELSDNVPLAERVALSETEGRAAVELRDAERDDGAEDWDEEDGVGVGDGVSEVVGSGVQVLVGSGVQVLVGSGVHSGVFDVGSGSG